MSGMNMMNRSYPAQSGCGCQTAQPCQTVQPRQAAQPCQTVQPRQTAQPCPCQQPNLEALNQTQLLNYINEVSFAAYDTLLFLDTHTCDGDALSYCKEMISLRENAKAVYVKRFGPLTIDCTNDCECGSWEWVMQPWPWESMQKGGCR